MQTAAPQTTGRNEPPLPQTRPAARGEPSARVALDTPAAHRMQAAVTALAPALIAAGLFYHPDIGTPGDAGFLDALAAAILADPSRWAVAHLAVGFGSALMILAFLAIHARLRTHGDARWSAAGLPFVVLGSVLFAMLPAMEFAPLAAAEAGEDIAAVQGALLPRFRPMLLAAAAVFAPGAVAFAVAIRRGRLLGPRMATLAAAALLVMAASRFVPLAPPAIHLGPLAGLVAFWPIAAALTRRAEEA